jgi:glutathione S-transferase
MTVAITLYGAPMSLFTGKVRAYLRKQHIPFDEKMPGAADCKERVFPAIKRRVVPVVELPDGQLVQDSVDIIDHFENHNERRFSVYPLAPKQRLSALVLDLFGSEGLFKVAMHFRWSFPEQNNAFLQREFGDHIVPGADQATVLSIAEAGMAPMRNYLPLMGIGTDSVPLIEAQYHDVLALLDEHFSRHPYLFGGLPTVADYGLLAPLYAHCARDPYPSAIMKTRAQRVYRWLERMQAPDRDMPEFGDYKESLFGEDDIPDTVCRLLTLVAEDFLPEMQETVAMVNRHLETVPADIAWQCVTAKPHIKMLGTMQYLFRGEILDGMVVPYRLYMLQRITDYYQQLPKNSQATVAEFFRGLGLESLLTLKANRRVERHQHIEVWGDTH